MFALPLQKYEFKVGMTCQGCANAVTRLLKQVPQVKNLTISVPDKQVIVEADKGLEPKVVLDKLSAWAKAGNKEVSFVKAL